MIFSMKKIADFPTGEPASALLRIVQLLLEAVVLHAVDVDQDEHMTFRSTLREIADRFEQVSDYRDHLVLAGEASRTIQSYNQQIEKFVRESAREKQLTMELLTQSLLRVCQASDQSAQNLRQIEQDLANASQLQDMKDLRTKLAVCVESLCRGAELQEAQYRELQGRLEQSGGQLEPRDQVTGLGMVKSAEARIKEISEVSHQGYVIAFFLKNVEIVNRRFGFAAGDDVLRRFASYLGKNLHPKDQLFRWRGPCFVVIGDRLAAADAVQAEATKIGIRGPEQEVECDGKSMFIRLIAASAVFPIPKGRDISDLSAKIDQFAADQFKMNPAGNH